MRYHNRALQRTRQSGYAPARGTVTVCEWPDGRLAMEYHGRALPWTDVTDQPALNTPTPIVAPRPARPSGAAVDHPWRRSYKGIRTDVPLWRVADR